MLKSSVAEKNVKDRKAEKLKGRDAKRKAERPAGSEI
jgi:hypothetical protein